ncbi:LysR family transcriptional regulator [Rhizobium sp. 2YAF20]|uniref:LysR family transcriptional regulator n=1 Tax=Rhizobium sp. 2YAF20 TaxID=3233027 RepID=UPI003F959FEC
MVAGIYVNFSRCGKKRWKSRLGYRPRPDLHRNRSHWKLSESRRALHVAQTIVSARIRTLEEELGRKLFIRNQSVPS